MKKALILVVLLLAIFVGEMLMFENNTQTEKERPFICVTSFPLYEISSKLLQDKIDIVKLIPFGVETHTYMPSVKTMSTILKAELFVYNGLGIEPWIKMEYDNALDMSGFVQLNKNSVQVDEHKEHDGHHHDDNMDPHYWLEINNMIIMTDVLQDRLSKVLPEYKDQLEENAKTYIHELKKLDNEYKKRLGRCKRKEIVVNHNAFGYLASAYGFSAHSLTGLSPDEQASAKKMKEITDLVKDEGIKIIFFESFVSDKISQTISKETGVSVQALQPLANVTEDEAKKGYILIMQENLHKLFEAMECE